MPLPSQLQVVQPPLLRLCHALAEAGSLESMFSTVVQALVDTTGCSRAAALAFDGAGVMRVRAAHGLSAEYRAAVEGHSPWQVGARDVRPIFVADVEGAPDLQSLLPLFRRENIRALAFLPIVGGGRLLGKFMLYAEATTDWQGVDLDFVLGSADLLASFLLREEAVERLQQARRMESLGLLAGGVAHDFNNLLTAMLGYADMIRAETMRGTPARAHVEDLLRTVERASELTRQLLGFARPDTSAQEAVDLGEFLTEAAPILQRVCGDRHRVAVAVPQEALVVTASRTQLHQLLLSLVTNARDAMAEGGVIGVTLVRGRLPETAELSVTDTGRGLDAASQQRLFEPLFSTKGAVAGAGLGLATCYAIVAACGGEISVNSKLGNGTTFVVRLPLGRSASAPPSTVAPAVRVLLVEDQEIVRSMFVRALVGMGFQVHTAVDGETALEVLSRHAVDVVVSDVVMPRLGGIELSKRIAAQWPGVRVLLVTGFVDEPMGVPPGVPVLGKPFLPRELAHRIRGLLATPS